MAFHAFNNWSDLYTYLVNEIGPNGNEEITGQKQQDALATVAASVITILASVPGETVNDFEAWSAEATYTGGAEVVVRHANKLWLFISGSDSTGTEPGTNGLVWQEISAVHLAHFRNGDVMLARATPNQVTAEELRGMLDRRTSWLDPIDGVLYWEPVGTEPVGYRAIIDTYDWEEAADYYGGIATRTASGWTFEEAPENGTAVLHRSQATIRVYLDYWREYSLLTPGIDQVLSASGDSPYNRLRLQAPLVRLPHVVSHVAAGPLSLPVNNYGRFQINVQADVEMTYATVLMAEWIIEFVGMSGVDRDITWAAGKWSRLDGVTMPASVALGERWLVHCVQLGGTVCVVWAGKSIDV